MAITSPRAEEPAAAQVADAPEQPGPMDTASQSGSDGGADGQLRMLDLPERGDSLAKRWVLAGIIAYLGLSATLTLTLYGQDGALADALTLAGLGKSLNLTVAVLVLGGIILFCYTVYRVWRDVRTMTIEEVDIEWVRQRKREGLNLVFADSAKREQLFRKGHRVTPGSNVSVETLTDDRVRRVQRALLDGRAAGVSVEELRIVAEQRTAMLGAFARYASSLLLLLAVLGTFAGVKSALPSLISALGAGGTAVSPDQLTDPLRAVSDAFGGNALALIGAIALGLMAQGVSFGRRHMLERLELVSAEYIYGDDTASTSDPLRAAVNALNSTANELHTASGTMLGIETGIVALGGQFEISLKSLAEQLDDIVRRQDDGLHSRTDAALHALQRRVGELSSVVEQNALTYQGLVDSIQSRTEESHAAIGQMVFTNDQLARGLDGLLGVGKRAEETFTKADGMFAYAQADFRQMESAATRIADANEQTALQVERIVNVVGTLDILARSDGREESVRQLAALRETLNAVDARLKQTDATNQAIVAKLGELSEPTGEVRDGDRRVTVARADVARAPAAIPSAGTGPEATASPVMQDREVVVLLRRIADQPTTWPVEQGLLRQLALQVVPVSVSALAAVLLTLAVLRWMPH